MEESDAIPVLDGADVSLPLRARFQHRLRARLAESIVDDSGCKPEGFAIYTLSDPRALREARYVGQTRAPTRRLCQHVDAARVWQPADMPWWFKAPALRPLYEWIRELYADECRLPCMVVVRWVPTLAEARAGERSAIYELLRDRRSLFNVECARLHNAVPLL